MRIEITWQENEVLKIPHDRYPRTCHAIKQINHPKIRKAKRNLAVIVLCGIGLSTLGAIITALIHPVGGGIAIVFCLLLFWLIFISIRRAATGSINQYLSLFNGETHTYTLDDEGVVMQSHGSTLRIYWNGIVQPCIINDWVLFPIRDYTYMLIPMRAFENDEHLDQFLAEVERRTGSERIDERL